MLEVVCWNQDRFRKEYLGEVGVSITELFSGGALSLDDPINQVPNTFLRSNSVSLAGSLSIRVVREPKLREICK